MARNGAAEAKRLLVLGAGPGQLGLLEAARARGLYVIAADIESLAGEVVNVATGVDISVAEIADAVLAVLGKPSSLKQRVDERPGQVARHIGSTEKAARLLGWRARTSFEDGLERTVEWYRENEGWWRGILQRERSVYSS